MVFLFDAKSKEALVEDVRKRVEELTATRVAPKGVTVRDLLPSDCGLSTNEEWTFTSGSSAGSFDMVDTTVPDNKYFAIYGVANQGTTEIINAINVKVGGSDKRRWCIQPMYALQDKILIFPHDEVIIIQENSDFTISGYADTASTTQELILLGVVGEQKGKTIDK